MCLYQLVRSYKRHKENKSKIGQQRSSMQQADYQCHRPTPWMQESVSMHESPTPVMHSRLNQARSEEEEKERKRIGKTGARRMIDRKKGNPTKEIPIWGTKTRPTQAQLRLTKQRTERLIFPSHRMRPPAPRTRKNSIWQWKKDNFIFIFVTRCLLNDQIKIN